MNHLTNTATQAITPSESLSGIRPLSVCLLISSLEFGGAERQVVELARTFNPARIKPFVCSLSREVPLGRFLPNGEKLTIVEKRARFDFTVVFRLARLLRRQKIDVVHAFLLDAEIAARLAAPLAGVRVVVASERNADYTRPFFHKIALKVTQPLFDVMIANSFAGKQFNMRTMGLRDARIEVVHNGVDVESFRPDRDAGLAFRGRLGIAANIPMIGMVGSFKRQKGHDCFLRMAAKVRQTVPDVLFLIAGEPVRDDYEATSSYQSAIKQLSEALNLADRCRFIDNQRDMKGLYNACDATVLLSRHEGTPNVVLESMACGVPVLVSDAADNAIIVRDQVTGYIVRRDDDTGAAESMVKLLSNPRARNEMGVAAREHVCQEYSIEQASQKMEQIYRKCLDRKSKSGVMRLHKVIETSVR